MGFDLTTAVRILKNLSDDFISSASFPSCNHMPNGFDNSSQIWKQRGNKQIYWYFWKVKMNHHIHVCKYPFLEMRTSQCAFLSFTKLLSTLPETNSKLMLGRRSFPFWDARFSGAFAASFREGIHMLQPFGFVVFMLGNSPLRRKNKTHGNLRRPPPMSTPQQIRPY